MGTDTRLACSPTALDAKDAACPLALGENFEKAKPTTAAVSDDDSAFGSKSSPSHHPSPMSSIDSESEMARSAAFSAEEMSPPPEHSQPESVMFARSATTDEPAESPTDSTDATSADVDRRQWTEDELQLRFATSAFDFAIPSRGFADDADRVARLPCRVLDDWYMLDADLVQVDSPLEITPFKYATMEMFRNKPNARCSCFSHRRVPLPDQTTASCNMNHPGSEAKRHGHKFLSSLEGYTLCGVLRPMHPQQDPVRVKLTDLVCYAVNHTKEHGGFWVLTPMAKYWLKDPSRKVQTIPKLTVRWSSEEGPSSDSKRRCESEIFRDVVLPSQHDLHQFRRAQLGLFAADGNGESQTYLLGADMQHKIATNLKQQSDKRQPWGKSDDFPVPDMGDTETTHNVGQECDVEAQLGDALSELASLYNMDSVSETKIVQRILQPTVKTTSPGDNNGKTIKRPSSVAALFRIPKKQRTGPNSK